MKAAADSPHEGFQYFFALLRSVDLIIVFVGSKYGIS